MKYNFDYNNMDRFDWQKILDNYPEAFKCYMKKDSFQQFLSYHRIVCQISEFYFDGNINYEVYLDIKDRTINIFSFCSKFSAEERALEQIFNEVEKQICNNNFENN